MSSVTESENLHGLIDASNLAGVAIGTSGARPIALQLAACASLG